MLTAETKSNIRTGYKILTHDWRPPIQGGNPLCDGNLPVVLPPVELDTGPKDCARGYNYTGSLSGAAEIASFWPDGRPAKCLIVSASADARLLMVDEVDMLDPGNRMNFIEFLLKAL